MGVWDGDERRNVDRDHDLLTKIDANLSNFMKRFDDHVADDKKDFDSLKERVLRSEKYIYFGIGGLFVIQFILSFIKK